MASQIDSRFVSRLTHDVDHLLQEVLDSALMYAKELQQVAPDFPDSAHNLLHYLEVRRCDIRR